MDKIIPARKQFMLTWLKNIVLCMAIVFALAYVFLIVPTAFQDWRDQVIALLLSTMIYGLSRYVLLPNIFKWCRFNAYLLVIWMTLVIGLFVAMPIIFSLFTGALVFTPGKWEIANFWPVVFLIVPPLMVAFFMYSWGFGVDKWLAYRSVQIKLDEMSLEAQKWELDAIAKNLDPHFIANSMATIRTLIRQSPDQALLAVGILGTIATFYLKIDNKPWLSLQLEMQMTHKLVNLYEFIKHQKIYITYENSEEQDFLVPKMLLFNLVENALQYGETSLKKYPIRIWIGLTTDNIVKLQVSNRIAAKAVTGKVSHNTALQRIERQLRLLDPQHAGIVLSKDESVFSVSVSFYRQSIGSNRIEQKNV
ncbi:histidine kinase [Sphingobacterium sp. InxBP1]|uniref:histidine kinase n=1 Tax=Sphingobacterium sp. InxBP1 TaxID=2870328 RepID=UPI0022443E0B|nr:histidine kinase [Sphingobacterium sp. InxBP1]MCW8310836.1 histidine kinase [Sphingobacterium sp. InxBP1]